MQEHDLRVVLSAFWSARRDIAMRGAESGPGNKGDVDASMGK